MIRSLITCLMIDDLSTFSSGPWHWGSFHKPQRSHLHQDKEESGKNALPPWPISAQDSVISINRVFALPHTKLTPISASGIPHIHAFTCRCRHWSKTSFIYTAQVSHFSLHPARRHRVEMASLGKAPLFSLKGIKEDHYQIFWGKFPFPDSRRRARFSCIKTYQGLLFH